MMQYLEKKRVQSQDRFESNKVVLFYMLQMEHVTEATE